MLRAAIRIDPFSPWLQSRLAWALHLDGQQTESLEQIHKCLSLFPNGDGASLYGAAILAFNGETAQACEIARSLEQRLPHFDLATAVHAYALAAQGGRTRPASSLNGCSGWAANAISFEDSLPRLMSPSETMKPPWPSCALRTRLAAPGSSRHWPIRA